ncbi:fimbria/pilus outer membrane usher protein [Pseudomonas lactis]|uniref:Fimbria/pilus outer membrane usher protein n=1 Tax=Pseudomonas lactis TaxID=1615674 RepID=A0ABS9FGR3_9PSED|nr:fimbria/pilus outer membrane usher protein [Pseudomonas lactis]MCF5368035.1 fimbria/pilus outer membrane usher protein [Pseudomonas sp. PA-4-8C]MCF4972742.1 fimbria/pilus outer membrane usher protein [Pseudomonas lactis]MCF4999106.1 fimbria/pilus outer membrane usher protein [Pseudomonas lactis]MCF5005491.1 fimbria/pilus outer membrane usher protein [Pseudomonas lactis]MCF5014144.1 fimbria/pilus outer membrane usher protein [Pseudomonas lactis]
MSYRDGEAVPDPFASPALALVLLLCALIPAKVCAEDSSSSGFDAQTLQQRGIDPQLASLLLAAPRYAAGQHTVSLRVNGQRRDRLTVNFDQQGNLCFDRALLDAANLVPPGETEGCHDFLARYPQTLVEPDPATLTVSLVVPTDALRPVQQDISGYETGGFAGLLNYDLSGFYNRFGDDASRFGSANTEVGFNAGDWIVRSRQVQTWQDGLSRSTHLQAYAQRTFASYQAVLQAGQINLYNPVLSGAQITGVQVLTEHALQEQGQGALIQGIANSPAQVEVRQNGALIHSTVVPAGPFALTDVRRLNTRSDVEVTVKESVGGERRFTVPAAMLGLGLPAPGYSVAAGRVRNVGDAEGEDPWVISGGWTGALHPQLTLGTGVLAASQYRSVGASLGWLPWLDSQIQLSTQVSNSQAREKVSGVQTDLSWSQRLGEQWSISAANSWRSIGYRELEESTYTRDDSNRDSRYRDQQSLNLGWSHPQLGAFSAGVSRSANFAGDSSSRALASWGTSIGAVSLSASAEWQMGGRQQQDNAVYLNISVPLGESRRLRSWVRNSGGENRTGLGITEQIDDQLSYRVSAEHDSSDHQVETTLGISALPRYSQLDVSYSRSDAERSSYQGGARGGVVLHGDGVTFSPYPVRDTFALVSVGDMSGIKLSTPSGPVWTDWQGQAVVPQVAAYGRSPVEVQTRSLPRNADINNGLAMVSAGRGAVERVKFGVGLTRRLLLTVSTDQGAPLPAGASVSSANGEFITLVQDGSQVFLPNVLGQSTLWITTPQGRRCQLRYSLPEKADPSVYFETAPARCHAP